MVLQPSGSEMLGKVAFPKTEDGVNFTQQLAGILIHEDCSG